MRSNTEEEPLSARAVPLLNPFLPTRSMSLHRSKQWDPPDRATRARLHCPADSAKAYMPAASCRHGRRDSFLRWGAIRKSIILALHDSMAGGGADGGTRSRRRRLGTATCRNHAFYRPRETFHLPSSISLIARL